MNPTLAVSLLTGGDLKVNLEGGKVVEFTALITSWSTFPRILRNIDEIIDE